MTALTVQQLAKISGVTVRTLHYYDEVGLLKPSFIKENGYRFYDLNAQERLQQILFFKEFDFSLEQIQEVMKSSEANRLQILEDQKQLLLLKKKRLELIVRTIDLSINTLKGGEDKMGIIKKQRQYSGQAGMTTSNLFDSFNMDEIHEYKKEAKERWGTTDAWKESQNNTKNWNKDDIKRVQQEWSLLITDLASTMGSGADSIEAQNVVDRIYKHLFQFYTPNLEMFRGLGEMYVADERFKKTFEKAVVGLAEFARDAIVIYCDRHADNAKSE